MALAFGIAAALGALKGIGGIGKIAGLAGGKGGGVLGAAKNNLATGGQGVLGAGQLIAGAIQRKKADALLPPSENVMERQMLQSIRRRRRALETGTAGSADRAAIRQMGKSFARQSFQGGGVGNFGQMAQLQSQAMRNLASTYGQQIGAQMQMEQSQVKSMADLANDLARLRSTRMAARAEGNIQGGSQNLLAALGPKGGAGEQFDKNYSSQDGKTDINKNKIGEEQDMVEDSAVDLT